MPDNGQAPQEVDLERTDRLPVVHGIVFADDVADDAVKLDFAPVAPSIKNVVTRPAVDLPALADSVRSVEERIARQSAENDALRRSYDRVLLEQRTASEAARAQLEQALHEAEHHQSEAHRAREAMAGRDATLARTLHSLAERDAQLHALQREHARVVPALEERSQATAQLEETLQAARHRCDTSAGELRNTQQALATLTLRLSAADRELEVARRELAAARAESTAHLESMRAREGHRESESADAGRVQQVAALEAERDRLNAALAERTHVAERAAEQVAADEALQLESLREEVRARDLRIAAMTAQIEELRLPNPSVGAEVQRLHKELGARTATVEQVNEENRALRGALERTRGALEERELLIRRLERSERNNANVLGRIQSSIERLGAVAGRTAGRASAGAGIAGGAGNGGGRGHPGTATPVPVTPDAGTASGSAPASGGAAMGVGAVADAGSASALPVALRAELVRIDGRNHATHALGSQTRIGRAPGSELEIDSSSVSRHHAYIGLTGSDIVIEDLNSTNGVLINGRKVARQHLHDGDTVTIGEATFRLHVRFLDP